jgi:FdhD protein
MNSPQPVLLNNPIFPWQVNRFTRTGKMAVSVETTPEEALVIAINGTEVAALPRTPGVDVEMAVGFAVSEGYLQNYAAIADIRYTSGSDQNNGAVNMERVDITAESSAARLNSGRSFLRLLRANHDDFDISAFQKSADISPLPFSHPMVSGAALLDMAEILRVNQVNYERTRGIHAAALFDLAGNMLRIYEDISRHNTVDKVLGWALMNHIPLTESLLLTTGRAGHKMVLKSARVGLPILASRSSPSSVAIQLAQSLNLTLIGYLAGDQGNLYTHGSRLIL